VCIINVGSYMLGGDALPLCSVPSAVAGESRTEFCSLHIFILVFHTIEVDAGVWRTPVLHSDRQLHKHE